MEIIVDIGALTYREFIRKGLNKTLTTELQCKFSYTGKKPGKMYIFEGTNMHTCLESIFLNS